MGEEEHTETNTVVMDERAVRRAIARMAREIVEANAGIVGLVLVGIHRRGVELSEFLADEIEKSEGQTIASLWRHWSLKSRLIRMWGGWPIFVCTPVG